MLGYVERNPTVHGWVEQWQLGGTGYVLYQLL
jgi:hypothetical protein